MHATVLLIPRDMQNPISMILLTGEWNRPEFGFLDLLFPWIAAIGLLGFLVEPRLHEGLRHGGRVRDQYEDEGGRVLELMDHYLATGEALEECRRLIRGLKIHHYWGHCGL